MKVPRPHRSHHWALIAIILLSVGTFVALTRQQANFNDHERLDHKFCELALVNRELLRDAIKLELKREGDVGEPTSTGYAELLVRTEKLIAQTKQGCSDE